MKWFSLACRWLDLLGGRRFLLTVFCHASVVWLRAHEHLGDGAFASVVTATTAAYIAANAHQRHLEAKGPP